MRLKIYELKDPRNNAAEDVYEYPSDLTSPVVLRRDCTLVSRQPLQIPILIVPTEYLTEKSDQRESVEHMFALVDLYDYWMEIKAAQNSQKKLNDKLSHLKEIFANGLNSQYSYITTFFTGPKPVYKQTFADDWTYNSLDQAILMHRGLFRTIDDLSVKGVNELFLKGTFECGDLVQENTQCKITFTRK